MDNVRDEFLVGYLCYKTFELALRADEHYAWRRIF